MPTPTVQQVVDGLVQEGYLVDLNVSKWAGQARLTEADLGLEGLTDSSLHRLGRKQLVAPEAIAKITAIEGRARARLTHRSFAFPFGQARFVPAKMLGLLLTEMQACKNDFDAAVEEFVNSYDALSVETRALWMASAEKLAEAHHKDDEGWLANFAGRLEQANPPKSKVRAAFDMNWNLYQFALPAGLQIKVIDAQRANQAATLALEAKARMEAQVSGFVSEANATLRQKAADLCSHIRGQLGDKISEKSLNPLRELVQEFRNMDFTGDEDFAKTLEDLQANYLGETGAEGIAGSLRTKASFREAFGKALDQVSAKVEGEAQRVSQEAVDRFLKFGNLGRKAANG
jgi:hypothetical protein